MCFVARHMQWRYPYTHFHQFSCIQYVSEDFRFLHSALYFMYTYIAQEMSEWIKTPTNRFWHIQISNSNSDRREQKQGNTQCNAIAFLFKCGNVVTTTTDEWTKQTNKHVDFLFLNNKNNTNRNRKQLQIYWMRRLRMSGACNLLVNLLSTIIITTTSTEQQQPQQSHAWQIYLSAWELQQQ